LSIEHREVIDLVYYHEKSVEEVAHILDIPPATVKTRMFYARKKIAPKCGSGAAWRAATSFFLPADFAGGPLYRRIQRPRQMSLYLCGPPR
jgi:hypothetical protein